MSWPLDPYPQVRSFKSDLFISQITIPFTSNSRESAVAAASAARGKAFAFFSPLFDNLDRLPYVYFTAGVTEGLSYSLRGRTVSVLPDEYRYVFSLPGIHRIDDHTRPTNTLLVSSPYSSSGMHTDLFNMTCRIKENLIVDASYLLASNLQHNPKLPLNTETILFGVSKSHDLADLRFGVMFTKRKIPGLHEMQYEYGYVHALVPQILDAIAGSPPNKLYLDNKERVEAAYTQEGLEFGDTLLFGRAPDSGRRIPWYWLPSLNDQQQKETP